MSDDDASKQKKKSGLADKAFGSAAEQFGKELVPVGKELGVVTAKVSLMLIGGLSASVYGIEKIGEWIKKEVSERLKDVPEDKIVQPNPRIAVPATQALLYSMADETIREMFANLLAADMNANTKGIAHPAFVEMIREMTPEDAIVLTAMKQQHQVQFEARLQRGDKWNELSHAFSFTVPNLNLDKIRKSVSNLKRLEIIEERQNAWPVLKNLNEIEELFQKQFTPVVEKMTTIAEEARKEMNIEDTPSISVSKSGLFFTPLGQDFARICLKAPD